MYDVRHSQAADRRDPGGFRGSKRERADCSGPDACSVVQRTTILEDEPMIQALSPDRADEPFHERFCHGLCGAVSTLLDAHAHHAMSKWLTVDAVTVADEIGRRGLVREGVDELLGGLIGRWGAR